MMKRSSTPSGISLKDVGTLVVTESGFLTEFVNQHEQRTDRPFCFVLGAGASRPSGIPSGADMAQVWLREIHEAEDFDGMPLSEWATAERLGIAEFSLEQIGAFYPQLYQRRFGAFEEAGYAFLEQQMEGKEPSYGYSVLAYLLSESHHRVVVTTNFDNLVADALSIHSNRFPIVVGHDALAQYAGVEPRRPLVAKIHGALGFLPKSLPQDISELPDGWKVALKRIFERYTPIFVGYEGNDGSLMGFLQSLPEHTPDRVFWCVYAPAGSKSDCLQRTPKSVQDFVKARRGKLVPIRGFDELMAKLLTRLRENGTVPDLYERLKERARSRESVYDAQQRQLFESPSTSKLESPRVSDESFTKAAGEIAGARKEKPWWAWLTEARAASSMDARDQVFRQALVALPHSADILKSYAVFLEQDLQDLDKAEAMYLRAIEAQSDHGTALAFYADFLDRYRDDAARADEFFGKSLAADPDDSYSNARYASFLEHVLQKTDLAQHYYQRALQIEPDSLYALVEYASFLSRVRSEHDAAESLFVRAYQRGSGHEIVRGPFADFVRAIRKDGPRADAIQNGTWEAPTIETEPIPSETAKVEVASPQLTNAQETPFGMSRDPLKQQAT